MSCKWVISLAKDNTRVNLSFSVFDLQTPSPTCQSGDFVEVREGQSPDSPILGTFCGSAIPSNVLSSGKFMLVHFRSDASVEKRGFVSAYVSVYEEKNGTFSLFRAYTMKNSPVELHYKFHQLVKYWLMTSLKSYQEGCKYQLYTLNFPISLVIVKHGKTY